MSKITLKTGHRDTTVSRTLVRDAVTGVFKTNPKTSSVKKSARVISDRVGHRHAAKRH